MEHPCGPTDLQLPEYVPVSLSQSTILTVYGLSSLLVVSLIWFLSVKCLFYGIVNLFSCSVTGRIRNISKLDRLLMCWWAFTGLTHIILEGYFAFSPEFYKDKTGFYLAEVWKEYSKGDSRYAARDSAVVAVEGMTAVLEGPSCLLAVYAIAKGKGYSYILQFAISLGQLYGTFVYFITAYLDSPFYYYAYYIFANSFWILIPSLILIRCWKKSSHAVQSQSQSQNQKKNKVR